MASIFSVDDLSVVGGIVIPSSLGDSGYDDPGGLIKIHGELVGPDGRSRGFGGS